MGDRKRFDLIIKTCLLLSPFFIINWYKGNTFSHRDQSLIFFIYFSVICLSLTIKNRWVGAFLFWSVLSVFRFNFNPDVGYYVSQVIWGCLWFFLITENLEKSKIKGILRWICCVNLLMIGTMIMQLAGLFPVKIGTFVIGQYIDCYGTPIEVNYWIRGLPGLIGQQNVMGAYLAITAPLFIVYGKVGGQKISFKLFRKEVCFKIKRVQVGLWLVLSMIVLTHSVGALISAFTGIVFYECFRKDRNKIRLGLWLALIPIGLWLMIKYIHSPGVSSRLFGLRHILSDITWLGHGLGSFIKEKVIFAKGAGGQLAQAHNEYAQVLWGLGIIGFTIVWGYLATIVYRFYKSKKDPVLLLVSACMVSFLINSLFNFTFHHGVLAFSGIALMGFLDITFKKEEVK